MKAETTVDRGLLGRLVWAGVRRQTANLGLGWLWWLIDPLVMVIVYAVVFGGFLGIGRTASDGGYPLFLACGLIPWRWFSQATTKGASALTQNTAVLTSFPVQRQTVVVGEIASASVPALMGFPVLAAFMLAYDRTLTMNLLYLPAPILVMATLVVAVSLVLCPLAVIVPDTLNLWGVLLRVAWFASPGLYRWEQVPEAYRQVYALCNPMVGVFEGIRRPIHDGLPPAWEALGYSAVWAFVLLMIGLWSFRRLEEPAVRLL